MKKDNIVDCDDDNLNQNSCKKEKALSTIQTGETRLVTKVCTNTYVYIKVKNENTLEFV